jgi:hypothetical protein
VLSTLHVIDHQHHCTDWLIAVDGNKRQRLPVRRCVDNRGVQFTQRDRRLAGQSLLRHGALHHAELAPPTIAGVEPHQLDHRDPRGHGTKGARLLVFPIPKSYEAQRNAPPAAIHRPRGQRPVPGAVGRDTPGRQT